MSEAILTLAQQAIQAERERREYAVVVKDVQRAYWIAQARIPASLEAYSAVTTCTVEHESGIACVWADFAFHLGSGKFRVMLQNDFLLPGVSVETVLAVIEKMVEDEREWDQIVSQPRLQEVGRRMAREALRQYHAGETEEGGFGLEP